MKRAIAFLHGVYRGADLPFYRRLCRGRATLAVDGGYSFFRKAGLAPDVLIGDFDSIKRMPRGLPESTAVLRYPVEKDRTDAHLALDYCVEQGAEEIDLVMPSIGLLDHAFGGILLLGLKELDGPGGVRPRVRVVNPKWEAQVVVDGEIEFHRCAGDVISVLPLEERVVLSCEGTKYDVAGAELRFGETRGMRNLILRKRAVVRLSGRGLVIHYRRG